MELIKYHLFSIMNTFISVWSSWVTSITLSDIHYLQYSQRETVVYNIRGTKDHHHSVNTDDTDTKWTLQNFVKYMHKVDLIFFKSHVDVLPAAKGLIRERDIIILYDLCEYYNRDIYIRFVIVSLLSSLQLTKSLINRSWSFQSEYSRKSYRKLN